MDTEKSPDVEVDVVTKDDYPALSDTPRDPTAPSNPVVDDDDGDTEGDDAEPEGDEGS